jgi:hypothetical protein
VIVLTQQNVGPGSTPGISKGGFRICADSEGDLQLNHEASIYAYSSIVGDTSATTNLPAAQLLCGSTNNKLQSLVITAPYQLADVVTPTILPPAVQVTFSLDQAGSTPDQPEFEEVLSF